MLEYPRWKYLLVALVLLLALLFALPNVFGEDPALQVARKDHNPVGAEVAQQIEQLPQVARRALREELYRQRPADGALRQRAGSAGGARRRQRPLCRCLHHGAVVRPAHSGGAARAGAAADAAGPRSARRAVPALPGGRQRRSDPGARRLRAGHSQGTGRRQHRIQGRHHAGGGLRQAERAARAAVPGCERRCRAQRARDPAAGAHRDQPPAPRVVRRSSRR